MLNELMGWDWDFIFMDYGTHLSPSYRAIFLIDYVSRESLV